MVALLLAVGACDEGSARPLVPLNAATPTGIEQVAGVRAAAVTTPTPDPTPTPASHSVAVCTGSSDMKDWFVSSASKANFDVYCAVLPPTWMVQKATFYARTAGDFIDIFYKGPGASALELQEGAQCTTSAEACSFHISDLGPTPFAALTGELGTHRFTNSPDFVIYVDPGTKHAYTLIGTNVGQADLVAFAKAMNRVAKG
jgi:hypothetical protein